MDNKQINLSFTLEETNLILDHLKKGVYEKVATLISKIFNEATNQVNSKQEVVEEEKIA